MSRAELPFAPLPGAPRPLLWPQISPFKTAAGMLIAWRSPSRAFTIPAKSESHRGCGHGGSTGKNLRGQVFPSPSGEAGGDHVLLSTGQLAGHTATVGVLPQASGPPVGDPLGPQLGGGSSGCGRTRWRVRSLGLSLDLQLACGLPSLGLNAFICKI